MHDTDIIIEQGLEAWMNGDLDALEGVLDPQVSLRWYEPGPWDCTGREQVMSLLRQRQTEGGRALPVRIDHIDEHSFVVSAADPADWDRPDGTDTATRITVEHGKVVAMQQYLSRDDAIAAAGEP